MGKGWRRTARAVAAGALGLLPLKVSAVPPEAPPAAETQTVPGATSVRQAAMQVELAWLADPITFAQPLDARVSGASLEVCGFVPDEVARQRALTLARRHAVGLTVLDGLALDPSLPPRAAPAPGDVLQQTARELLRRGFGTAADGFRVSALGGVVTVDGAVPTVEERLGVSRRLRQLSGCTAVVNRLTLSGGADQPVVATGIQAVPPKADVLATPPVPMTWANERETHPATEGATASGVHPARAANAGFAASRVVGPAVPAAAEIKATGFAAGPSLGPPAPVTPAELASGFAIEGKRTLPTMLPPASEPESKDARKVPAKAVTAVRPPTGPHDIPAPNNHGWPPAFVNGDADAGTMAVVHKEEVAAPPPLVRTEAGVAPAALPRPPQSVPPQLLRQRIEKACGRGVRKVEVVEQDDHSTAVRVYLATAGAEKSVTELLVRMPELGATGIKLEVMVPR